MSRVSLYTQLWVPSSDSSHQSMNQGRSANGQQKNAEKGGVRWSNITTATHQSPDGFDAPTDTTDSASSCWWTLTYAVEIISAIGSYTWKVSIFLQKNTSLKSALKSNAVCLHWAFIYQPNPAILNTICDCLLLDQIKSKVKSQLMKAYVCDFNCSLLLSPWCRYLHMERTGQTRQGKKR